MNKNKSLYTGCIYMYTNKINNKVYIGQSSDVKQRYAQHKDPNTDSTPIDKAIKKYGIENFDFRILVVIDRSTYDEYKNDIDELETFYMEKYRRLGYTLYNITEKGGGNTWAMSNKDRVYKPHTQEEKDKISKKLKEYWKTHKPQRRCGELNSRAKRIVATDVNTGEVLAIFDCGKLLCMEIGMNYSTFKYKMQRKGILADNILYRYESNIRENS